MSKFGLLVKTFNGKFLYSGSSVDTKRDIVNMHYVITPLDLDT